MMQVDKNSTVLIFFVNGINTLLGWNAVLAALDYFAQKFKDFNIYSFLPIPLFAGFLIIGLSYHHISNKLRYSKLILIGNMVVNVSLFGMFLVSVLFQNNTFGFVLLQLLSLFLGLGGNVSQMTFFAMINYLSRSVVSKFTVGTAFSGLFMIVVRSITLAIFVPILVYFSITILFNSIDTVMNLAFCRSDVYKLKIDRFLLHKDQEKEPDNSSGGSKGQKEIQLVTEYAQNKSEEEEEDEKMHVIPENYERQEERIQTQPYFTTLKETFYSIIPFPLVILGTLIITFALFPGPAFSKKFPRDAINGTWAIILLNLSFNLGDASGKFLAELRGAFNPISLYYVFFSRFFFFLTISFMANNADNGDALTDNMVFPFVNLYLCGFTNGFSLNASFIMSFTVCPFIYKKYAGVLCGLMLQIGIIVGTVIEIPYAYILGIS